MFVRRFGLFLGSAFMCSGVAVATASPSSAVIDNRCLDQQHWDAQFSTLNNAADNASAVVYAWDHTVPGTDPQTGAPTYTATLPNGYSAQVLGDTALTWRQRD